MGEFIFDNLEIFVFVIGGIGCVYYLSTKKIKKSVNNLTPYVIKLKKQQDVISKQCK